MDWTRIETAFVGTGMPDTSGIFIEPEPRENGGHEFWLELKVAKSKDSIPISLWRPAQIAWQTKRARAGGRVWNLVHHPSSSILQLIHGNRLTTSPDSGIIPDLTVNHDQVAMLLEHIRNH